MKFPKQPGKSYPHNESRVPTEKLKALLKDNPDLVINNINLADYYRLQIAKLINPDSESYIVTRPLTVWHTANGQQKKQLIYTTK